MSRIHCHIGSARIVIRARDGEGHHTLTSGVHANRGEQHAVVIHGDIALLRHGGGEVVPGQLWTDDKVGDTYLAAVTDDGVDTRPQHAIGIDDLVHAVIVASKLILRLTEQLPLWEVASLLG